MRLNRLHLLRSALIALALTVGSVIPTMAQQPNPKELDTVTLFVGYIPNIQFAPIYVALEKGYFAEMGFDVRVEHSTNETDGVTRIGLNQLQFGIVGGDQVILAREKGAPLVYVASWYQKFPVGIVTSAESGIKTAEDLIGKNVGVPGKFGASYIGFQAFLNAAGMKESDLKSLQEIGFNTAPVICSGKVDAAVVYIANEPLQIEKTCFKTTVISIAADANLVSNGIVTNEETIKNRPTWVRGMVAAFLRGLDDTIKDPDAAYQISKKYVENLGDDPVQMEVLKRSIETWKAEDKVTDKGTEKGTLGQIDPARWTLTQETLLKMKLIEKAIDLTKAYSTDFLPTP
jgi:NitT/TauT family transport system substrate-binding protein